MSSTPIARLLTPAEVGEILAVNEPTVLAWHREGKLDGVKLSRKVVRFRAEQVEAFISDGSAAASSK